jgi:hypothetical protein
MRCLNEGLKMDEHRARNARRNVPPKDDSRVATLLLRGSVARSLRTVVEEGSVIRRLVRRPSSKHAASFVQSAMGKSRTRLWIGALHS